VTTRAQFKLPPERERLQRRAIRLEWITIAVLLVVSVVMYASMGSSQAMKTAWAEDLLSLVPPIAYLVASRVRAKPANPRFPYGYHRAISIAFLCAALALLSLGLLLLAEAVSKLVTREHPTIESIELFGRHFWQGWLMMGVLAVTGIAPVVLGRLKLPLGSELHDKALHADADMNKADWLTAIAGILGLCGIAVGWWWADAAAAGFISLEITRDGAKNVSRVVKDLMDQAPTHVKTNRPHELPSQIVTALQALPWVRRARVRLREEGHVFSGEAFVVAESDHDLTRRIAAATSLVRSLDWRICEVVITPEPDANADDGGGED
jgi:cation diffusion facilitator family transporter